MTICVRVIGAGVAGLTAAYEFARAGCDVELVERREGPGLGCSYLAGGMISPWCEEEGAEPLRDRNGHGIAKLLDRDRAGCDDAGFAGFRARA